LSLRGANIKRTVCEVLREIYDIAQSDSAEDVAIRRKLVEAEKMCKKMAKALYRYNKDFDANWWLNNPNYDKAIKRDLNRRYIPDA